MIVSLEAALRRCSARKVVIKNFAKFTVKHLYRSPVLTKVSG